MAIKVDATYIGGYPDGNGQEMSGQLVADETGLTFSWKALQTLPSAQGRFAIPNHEITAVSLEAVDPIRAIKPVLGNFRWTYGPSSRVIAIRCRREQVELTALFETDDIASRQFVDGWQRNRQAVGLPPLPSIENLHPSPADAQQLELLREISAKLDRLLNAFERPT